LSVGGMQKAPHSSAVADGFCMHHSVESQQGAYWTYGFPSAPAQRSPASVQTLVELVAESIPETARMPLARAARKLIVVVILKWTSI
jgi:hypothetical protein